jgi:hypothetical protein
MSTETLGQLLTKLHKARQKKIVTDAAAKEADGEVETAKKAVLDYLQAQGMEKGGDKNLTVSVTTKTVPTVKDWDAFYAFIKKNNYFHLLHRRVSEPAWREIHEQLAAKKKEVPGTEPFTKIDLSVTAVKS